MKIVVDATSLLLPSAGVRNYLQYWLLSLLELSSGNDQIATHPLRVPVPSKLDHERSAVGNPGTFLRLALTSFLNVRGNPAIDLMLLGADVFHSSQHTANVPRLPNVTATVFDLSCWLTPEYHTAANVVATRRYGERVLKSADGLIAISAHARDEAIEVLRIPRERIRVIYPGVAEPFFQVTKSQQQLTQTKYKIDRPYLLFVGCIEPRKNVRGIIQAYGLLSDSVRSDLQLIVAGPFGWETEELRNILTAGQGNVRYLGYVPECDLPGLVSGAAALLYPSFYEGFGLPAAQAMAAGVPVIGSDRSCLPEVIGDAGIFVNPDSVEDLSAAIHRIYSNPDLSAQLSLRGRVRSQRFRWSVCAAESLQFFRDVSSARS
jgi:glycosyltransferase involved in cell wall biosynthesis